MSYNKVFGLIVLLALYAKPGSTGSVPQDTRSFKPDEKAPVDEFCSRLAATCPYLRSPTADPFTYGHKVQIGVAFTPARFLGIKDIEQQFSLQGTFYFVWQLPSCAMWDDVYGDSGVKPQTVPPTSVNSTTNSEYDDDLLLAILGQVDNATAPTSSPSSSRAKRSSSNTDTSVFYCYYDTNTVWHPQIEHFNRMGQDSPFNMGSQYVAVDNTGIAAWQASGQFDSSCSMTLKKFPYDTQNCSITIGMKQFWDEISFSLSGNLAVKKYPFSETDIWKLVSSNVSKTKVPDYMLDRKALEFSFVVQRKSECYTGNVFLPMILLMILQASTYAMPADMPDRAGFSITIFLSGAVLLTVVSSNIPTSAESLHLMTSFAAQITVGVAVTIYSLITCRLASNEEGVFQKKVGIYKKWQVSVINLCDIVAFAGTTVAYIVIIATLFSNIQA